MPLSVLATVRVIVPSGPLEYIEPHYGVVHNRAGHKIEATMV